VADIRRRAQQLSTIVVVVALHIAACWLFLATTRPLTIAAISQRLQLVFITPPVSPARTRRSQRASQQNTAAAPAAQPNTAASSKERSAIHPPIDWAGELDRAARDSVPAEPPREPRDFGFPHASTARSSKPPEFSWSHTRTHRVESIPGGGLLVHVNDNCVLVLIPLPFFACAPGKKPANGDLFKHLHDPSQAGDWNDPK